MSRRTALACCCVMLTAAAAQEAVAPSPEDALRTKIETAERLRDEGKVEEALALLKAVRGEAAQKQPWAVVRCLMLEGGIQAAANNWRAAEASFQQVVDGYPAWPEVAAALEGIGAARLAQDRLDDARQTWTRLIAECPHSWSRFTAEQQLFEADLRERKLDQAGARLAAFLKQFPWHENAPWMLSRLGMAQLDAGQTEAALATFEQVRRDYPGTEPAYTVRRPMVEALVKLKRTDAALALLEGVEREQPEMFVVAEAATLRAETLVDADRPAEAVAALDRLVERYPGTFVAAKALWRGAAILKDRDPTAAAARLKHLAEAFPAPFWRVQTLGLLVDLHRTAERWDDAEDAAAALAELTAGSLTAADALLQMAEIQWAAGRRKAARATAQRIAQTCKGAPVVPLAEQLLHDWDAAEQAGGGG